MAQINAEMYYLANDVFRRKFPHKIHIGVLKNTPPSIVDQFFEYTGKFIGNALGFEEPEIKKDLSGQHMIKLLYSTTMN